MTRPILASALATFLTVISPACEPPAAGGASSVSEDVESASPPEAPELSLDERRTACLDTLDFDACEAVRRQLWKADDLEAVTTLADALEERHPDHRIAIYLRAQVHYQAGRFAEAEAAFVRFMESAVRGGDPRMAALGAQMAGSIREDQSDWSGAAERYGQSAHFAQEAGLRVKEASAWYSASFVHRAAGRFQLQADALERVVDLMHDHPEYRRVARTALSGALRRLGRLDEAEDLFERVIADDEAAALNAVRAWIGLSVLAMDRERYDEAAANGERAAAIAEEAGDANLELHGLALAAKGHARAGRGERALTILEASSERLDELDAWHHMVYSTLAGDATYALGRPDEARRFYEEAQARAIELGDTELGWLSAAGLARLASVRGDREAALRYARTAVDQVEQQRESIDEVGERTHFLQLRSDVYRILAGSLPDSRLDAVFDTMERAHARTLAESLGTTGGIDRERRSLTQIRRALGPGDLLLEYLLGEDESLLLAVTRDGARLIRLAPQEELERLTLRYRDVLMRPLTQLDARVDPQGDFLRVGGVGHELYRALLGPVQDELAAVERLIVVPDRRLYLLPFETLPVRPVTSQAAFLGANHPVVYLPGARFLGRTEPLGPKARAVILANERGSAELDLAALRHAADEANAIARSYTERSQLLSGDRATLDDLRRTAEQPIDVLHVVAHTVVRSGAGPQVVLNAGGEAGADAFLDAQNVRSLPHAPRLAVLSCCETARGELVGGEGILGLVRAFTEAGTSSIVATLWMVDDETSARLMVDFHRELASGASPSAALHAARRAALAEGFVHPFFWAPFVLYGAD